MALRKGSREPAGGAGGGTRSAAPPAVVMDRPRHVTAPRPGRGTASPGSTPLRLSPQGSTWESLRPGPGALRHSCPRGGGGPQPLYHFAVSSGFPASRARGKNHEDVSHRGQDHSRFPLSQQLLEPAFCTLSEAYTEAGTSYLGIYSKPPKSFWVT